MKHSKATGVILVVFILVSILAGRMWGIAECEKTHNPPVVKQAR